MSKVTDNMPEPFDMRLVKDKGWLLSVPANIEAHDRMMFRQIIALANRLKVHIVATSQTIHVTKETEAEKDFFYGFFKLLSRKPVENERFSFNMDSISSKGAAQCKLIIMQKALKGSYADVQQFLPSTLYTEKGGRKLDIEIGAIATGQKANIAKLPSTFTRLVELWIDTEEGKVWSTLAFTYNIPTPLILDGLHKKVVEKVKGKDVVHIKKPKRPSKRIEVLSKLEKQLIMQYEIPFDDYKKKMQDLGKEISINLIKSVREELKLLIQKMWLVVEKFSAPLTKRRTAMIAHLSEKNARN